MGPDRESLLIAADAAHRAGDLFGADRICRQLLEQFPDDLTALLFSGVVAVKLDQPDAAFQSLRKALSIDPRCVEALNWLSGQLRASGELAEAIQLAEAAVSLRPGDADALVNLALCQLAHGQQKDAIQHLQNATQQRPNAGPIHLYLGTALESAGRDSEADQAYRRAVKLSPRSAEARVAFAKLRLAHGDFESAIEALQRALELRPNSADIHLCLAQALIGVDREDEAITHLSRAIELNPGSPDAYAMLGYRLQTRGLFAEARTNFEKSIELEPFQSVSYYGITQGAKIDETARPMVDRMLEIVGDDRLLDRDRMYLLFAIGKAYGDLREFESAMDAFHSANRLAFQVCLGGREFLRKQYSKLIDATIETYTKAYLESHRALGSNSRKPIFIVGMLRSGTTLVDQILSSHPGVGSMGEREFWLNLGQIDPESKDFSRCQEQYLLMLDRAAPTKNRITDKTPQNFQVLGLIHLAFPDAVIIHVRRNPLDNCLSIYTTAYDRSPDFAHDPSSIVLAYREYQRLMAHWRAVLPPDRFVEVVYEELISNQEDVVRKVTAFCNLSWSDTFLSHELSTGTVKTPSMWQVRQPLYGSSINRWRNYEPWLGELRDIGDG